MKLKSFFGWLGLGVLGFLLWLWIKGAIPNLGAIRLPYVAY